jgi:hypothetical protein
MANEPLRVECTDMDAFKYSSKDLPRVLKERFIAEGGDITTAKLTHNGYRWVMDGAMKPCYDLSGMD